MENFREKRLERQLKSQRTTSIVIAVLLILSILANIWLIVRVSNVRGEVEEIAQERDEIIYERDAFEQETEQLESEVEALNQQIEGLRQTAEDLESEVQARGARIAALRRQLGTQIEDLQEKLAELEGLEEEYRILEEEREELLVKIEDLEDDLTGLREEHQALGDLVDRATYLQAYNVHAYTVRDRWWGRPVLMEVAGRVTRTMVSFEINSSLLVEPAAKDVHVVMLDPEGQVVNPSNDTFTIEDTGEESPWTVHTTFQYDQRSVPLMYRIEHEDGLTEGVQTVEVYINGEFGGSTSLTLE